MTRPENSTDGLMQKEPRRGYSPEMTQEVRKAVIRRALDSTKALTKQTERINVSDTARLSEVATDYIERCKDAGLVPNLEGLAASIGCSRRWLYIFCDENPQHPSAALIDRLRSGWMSLRFSLSEARVLDPATVIFIAKNSGLGYSDRQEYEFVKPDNPLSSLGDPEAARRRILEALPDLDDE